MSCIVKFLHLKILGPIPPQPGQAIARRTSPLPAPPDSVRHGPEKPVCEWRGGAALRPYSGLPGQVREEGQDLLHRRQPAWHAAVGEAGEVIPQP